MKCLIFCLSIAFASGSFANPPATLTLEKSSPEEILQIVKKWQALYESGEVLLKNKEVQNYEAELTNMVEFLSARDSWADLNQKDQIKFVNRYEQLRALTDGGEARGNRRICTRERRRGSNLKTTICVSAAEQARIDKMNSAALSDIERNGRREHVSERNSGKQGN
jgi:hypothetical protein